VSNSQVQRQRTIHKSRSRWTRLRLEFLEDRTLLNYGPVPLPANVVPITWFGQKANAVAGQWVARFSDETGSVTAQVHDIQSMLDSTHLGLVVMRQLGLSGQVLIQAPAGVTYEQMLALTHFPGYKYFEPNFFEADPLLDTIPNDPFFNLEYGMRNTGQTIQGQVGIPGADISATQAWDISTGSTHVTIADIDTGTDFNHPDLYNNIWINQAEIPLSRLKNLTDIDGDGLITFRDLNDPINQGPGKITDLTHHGRIDASDILQPMILDDQGHDTGMGGWAYPGNTQDGDVNHPNDFIGWNFVNNTNSPFDDHSHGTHTSGTIAAEGNNGIGVAGVNWTVQLMPDKWIAGSGSGQTADAIAAVNYSVLHGASVSSNSWHVFEDSQGLYDAIANARTAGDLFVAAAGNDGHNTDQFPNWPSIYVRTLDNIISVAATDNRDARAGFSNYGIQTVNLGGPGVNVYSTFPNSSYGYDSGTSMATPHVAGSAALALSIAHNASYQDIRNAIFDSVDPIPALRVDGPTPVSTGGRLNAFHLLEEFHAAGPVVRSSTPTGNVSPAISSVRFTFDVPINVKTFTVDKVDSFTGPNGDIAVKDVQVVPSSGNLQFDVFFDAQTTPGSYSMTIGPDIEDEKGNQMDQDRNGIPGEPSDVYTAQFTIQGPVVVRLTPTGNTFAPIDTLHAVFNTAMDINSFADQVSVTDPNGKAVSILSVTETGGTGGREYDIAVSPQDGAGTYTAVLGAGITDRFANPLAQPFTSAFTIVGPSVQSTDLSGRLADQVDHGQIVFNTPINPDSFTFDQFILTAPDGSTVNVNSIMPADNTNRVFNVTFDLQTRLGNYTLVVGPNIADAFGNPMPAPYRGGFMLSSERIINGGFETGNFMGWTQSGNTGATGVSTGTVHSGMYSAYLGPVGSEGFLAQIFPTTAGVTYVLDYWLQHDGGSPSSFHAMINGVDIPGSVLMNPAAFGYREYTFTFTAAGSQTELKFGFREDPTYFHLDDVSVSPTGAPGGAGRGGHTGSGIFSRLGNAVGLVVSAREARSAATAPLPAQEKAPPPLNNWRIEALDQVFASPQIGRAGLALPRAILSEVAVGNRLDPFTGEIV